MSEENLDAAIAAAKQRKAAPVWGRATAAAEESARRNPSSTLWTERRRSIGFWPFYLEKNTSQNVIVLGSPHVFVVHRFLIGWNDQKGKSFPEHWYGVCDKWRLPEDPEQAGFEATGKPCFACRALGEVKSILVLPIALQREWTSKQGTPRTYQWQLRALIVDQAGAINQLRDQASLQPHGDLRFCQVKITRSAGERAPRIGDSFTVVQRVSEAAVKNTRDITDQMTGFSIPKTFAPLTGDEMRAALVLHKRLSDRKNNGADYDAQGMAAALNGDAEEGDDHGLDAGLGLGDTPAAASTATRAQTAAASLDDFPPAGDEAEPSFDDLAAETPAAKPASAPAQKPTTKPAAKPTAPTTPPTDDPWS